MNVKSIALIYLKELKELFRSVGLVFVMLVFPLIMYPAAVMYSGDSANREKHRIDSSVCVICIKDRDGLLPDLKGHLESDGMIRVSGDDVNEISKDCNAIVEISRQPDLFAGGYSNALLSIRYNSTDRLSVKSKDRIKELVADLKNDMVYDRLEEKGVSPDIMDPLSVDCVNEASKESVVGSMIGDMLPFLVIMMIISGATQIAVDITSGEKDRKTIQTLLMSPVGRKEIAAAKILVVATASFANCIINLLSIAISFNFLPKSPDMSIVSAISPSACLIAMAVLIPFIIFSSSLLIVLGFAAKNQVEAGIFTMPVIMIGMMSGISVSSLDISSINIASAFIPFYGTAVSIKTVFASSGNLVFAAVSSAACLIYAGILAFAASRLFLCEAVAFSGISDIVMGQIKNKLTSFKKRKK